MRNPTLLQCFHWYYPKAVSSGLNWPSAQTVLMILVSIWSGCRPPIKAHRRLFGRLRLLSDLFDSGEFDQKGSIPTKYGDKAQLLAAIDALKRNDIAVLLDVVVNHKMGADEKKLFACSV